MKRPKPRDYGLDSDHPSIYTDIPVDPEQPFTSEELNSAWDRLIYAEALRARQRRYEAAYADWQYNNGGR